MPLNWPGSSGGKMLRNSFMKSIQALYKVRKIFGIHIPLTFKERTGSLFHERSIASPCTVKITNQFFKNDNPVFASIFFDTP